MEYYGKPCASTYRYTEALLAEQATRLGVEVPTKIWGIGDNPLSDIRGANNAGEHWGSVLVRSGVWDGWKHGEANCLHDPAKIVVDDVLSAIEQILKLRTSNQ